MIKLIKPYISFQEVEKEFRDIFDSGVFTKGSNVTHFNDEIRKYTGAHHSFLTTSATTALTMCLKLLDITQGDEVIVSDFSFPASANVVEDVGATSVLVDVDPATFNMMPEALEQAIGPRTKAVIFVDALGNPTGIQRITEICKKHRIPLIEDAACAIGSSEGGMKCGNIADLTCFSFHPRKLLTTGEGGAITTNHGEWAERLAVKLNHGAVVEGGKFDFVDFGYNYRLPELQAVMGIKQLAKLDTIVAGRLKLRDRYARQLEPQGFRMQKTGLNTVHNVQSLVCVVPPGTDRDSLIQYLKQNDVESTLGTYCLSGTTFYERKYGRVQPNAHFLARKTITLPCYEGVDVESICTKIRAWR